MILDTSTRNEPSFTSLWTRLRWREISGCPGRFVCDDAYDVHPAALLAGVPFTLHESPRARDQVVVAVFEGGGLITYVRKNGSYCHTLNTPDGLVRKLAQLEIAGADTDHS